MQQRERLLIGDMSVTGLDTLLQLPRIGAIHQHLYIVIRLQVEKAATAQFFSYQARDDPQIGNGSRAPFTGFDNEADRIATVMSNRNGIYLNISEVEG